MYIPIDPDSIDGMWNKLKISLTSQKNCLILLDGTFNNDAVYQVMSLEASDITFEKIKSRNYVRLGSSHLILLPAHFAINIIDNVGKLKEYISSSTDEDTLKNDITFICQFTFFENRNLKKLIIPFVINGIEDPELKVEIDDMGMTLVSRI